MRGEGGQASVEWIGVVLLLTLSLAAIVRFAPRADADALGPELLHAIGCAAGGGCEAPPGDRAQDCGDVPARHGQRAAARADRARRAPGAPARGVRLARRPAPASPARARLGVRSRGGAAARALARPGAARACSGGGPGSSASATSAPVTEFLHPEIRFPHVPIPLSENLRMANDCLSPVDLVRDWDLIRGPR